MNPTNFRGIVPHNAEQTSGSSRSGVGVGIKPEIANIPYTKYRNTLQCLVMKPPEHLKPQGGQFNLTPMIDVIFLLIIFFMLSYNMTQQDSAILVDLPAAETRTPPQGQQTKQLTISIPSPGRLYVGTEKISDRGRLRHIMAESRKDWGEETAIRIRTSRDVPHGEIKPILRMAAESGIIHVSFAVLERSF